jgi:hypothetical protein
MEVVAPADETTLEGQFQLGSRDLIAEIRALGFDPFVWVGLINDLGAVGTAESILADHGILPVTHWTRRSESHRTHVGTGDRTD